MTPSIGLLINGSAKKIRTGKISVDALKALDPDGIFIVETRSVEDIDGAVKAIMDRGCEYLGILGGDGTIHLTLGRMMRMMDPSLIPPMLILKGGTQDHISISIGLKGKSVDILRRFIEAKKASKKIEITYRDTMRIDDRYCFLFGFGMVTNFLKEAYKGSEKGIKQNLKTIGKAVSQAFIKPKEDYIFGGVNAEVSVDGKKVHFNYITALLAGTVEHLAFGFKPLPRANEKQGCFHALITGATAFEIVSRLRSVKNGKPIKHPRHCDTLASHLRIEASSPFDYTMDGDIYVCGDALEVHMGPRIPFVSV